MTTAAAEPVRDEPDQPARGEPPPDQPPPSFQLVVDCREPARLVAFWSLALGYVVEPPPPGYDDWSAYWRGVGLPPEEADGDDDRIVDPRGAGPRIYFQVVPEPKSVKNRLHLDVGVGGGREHPLADRAARVEAMAERLVAAGATRVQTLSEAGLDHYAVAMLDPEGNEFDVN